MKGLYRRHKRYWLRFSWNGEQRFINLGTESESEAIEVAHRILADPSPWVSGQPLLLALLDEFLALKSARGISDNWTTEERTRLGAFFRDYGIGHPTGISRAKVTEWIDSHLTRNPETANSYLSSLARFTRWMKDRGHLKVDPCSEIPRVKTRARVRRRFLSRDECRRLLEAATDRNLRTAIYLGLHAGLRKGEVLAAAPHWVDLPGKLLHVQASKGWQPKDRDNRTIPITDEFATFLAECPLPSDYLAWPKARGQGRYRFDFRKPFTACLERAGIECTFHDLRRTFASLHVSAGTSIYKVARWLGDGVAVVEQHYGHLVPADAEINRAWS